MDQSHPQTGTQAAVSPTRSGRGTNGDQAEQTEPAASALDVEEKEWPDRILSTARERVANASQHKRVVLNQTSCQDRLPLTNPDLHKSPAIGCDEGTGRLGSGTARTILPKGDEMFMRLAVCSPRLHHTKVTKGQVFCRRALRTKVKGRSRPSDPLKRTFHRSCHGSNLCVPERALLGKVSPTLLVVQPSSESVLAPCLNGL